MCILWKHRVYFLGFGFPHALVSMVAGSYLMGYGLYAVAFPFCILLGVTRNASRAYKKHNAPAKPLPVFRFVVVSHMFWVDLIYKQTCCL